MEKIVKCIEIEVNADKGSSNILYSNLFDDVEVVTLQTLENNLIGEVTQIEYIDDTIYIFDAGFAKSLFMFNREGLYIGRVGVLGKGVGEYIYPTSFWVEDNQILIYDMHLHSIFFYNKKGDFLKKIEIEKEYQGRNIAHESNNIYVDVNKFQPDKNKQFLIRRYNHKGVDQEGWLEYPKYNKGWNVLNFWVKKNFIKTKFDVKYINGLCNTVFTINNGNISPYLLIVADNEINRTDINKAQHDIKNSFGNLVKASRKCFVGINQYIENETTIYLRYFGYFNTQNDILYMKNTGKIQQGHLFDDITKLESASLNNFNDEFAISVYNIRANGDISNWKQKILNGEILLSKSNKEKVMNINNSSNPILFFYRFR